MTTITTPNKATTGVITKVMTLASTSLSKKSMPIPKCGDILIAKKKGFDNMTVGKRYSIEEIYIDEMLIYRDNGDTLRLDKSVMNSNDYFDYVSVKL